MAVTESTESRSEHVTATGTVLTQVQHCTWTDWDDIDNLNLAIIGDYWSADRQDMRCTDIKVAAYAGNEYCKVVTTWSTEGYEDRVEREDQIASWEDSLSVSMEEASVTAWYDRSANGWYNWKTEWESGGEAYTEDNMPDMVQYKPRMDYAITAYGSASLIARFADAVGMVNSINFIAQVQDTLDTAKSNRTTDTSGFEDAGKLMFMGCNRTLVRSTCYRYELNFLYDTDGWNLQHGVTTNMYNTMDFMSLLNGMDRSEDEYVRGNHSD